MEQEITEEEKFIDKVLSQWNTAYARKDEQAELIRIILNKLEELESQINNLKSYL